MPTVWSERMVGNANTELDSRTQVLRAVASSQIKKVFMPVSFQVSIYVSFQDAA